MDIERRHAFELRADTGNGKRLFGYAAKFDVLSEDLGGFREKIRHGAFRRTLTVGNADPLCLLEHDRKVVLGRKSAGTLRLTEDRQGLAFEVDVPPTSAGLDLLVSVSRGDIRHGSFGFKVPPSGDKWEVEGDAVTRTLLDVDLLEISICSTPAYPDTEVARRHLESLTAAHPWRLNALRCYLETV